MNGTRLERIAADFVGTASLNGRRSQSWFFVTMVGFTNPGIVAKYDFTQAQKNRWSIYRSTLVKGLKVEDFQSQQVRIDYCLFTRIS